MTPAAAPSQILSVSENFLVGGLETQIYGQLNHLAKQGVTLHLATCSPKDRQHAPFGANFLNLPEREKLLTVGGVIAAVELLLEYVKARKIDFIHAHPARSFFPAFLAAGLAGIPMAMTMHGRYSATQTEWTGATDRWLYSRVYPRYAHSIFAVSQGVANMLSPNMAGENIVILQNGVDFSQIKQAGVLKNPRERWAVVSRLDDDKWLGVRDFFRYASQTGIKKVEIFGGGGKLEELKQFTIIEKLQTEFLFHGPVDKPWEHLTEGFSGLAGMGRVLLEGAALGIPFCLLGNKGVYGLVGKKDIPTLRRTNFSSLFLSAVDAKFFENQLDALANSPEDFHFREALSEDFDEGAIWKKFVNRISVQKEIFHLPVAFWDWLKTEPNDTNATDNWSIIYFLEKLLAENGHPASAREARLPTDIRMDKISVLLRNGAWQVSQKIEEAKKNSEKQFSELSEKTNRLSDVLRSETSACEKVFSELTAQSQVASAREKTLRKEITESADASRLREKIFSTQLREASAREETLRAKISESAAAFRLNEEKFSAQLQESAARGEILRKEITENAARARLREEKLFAQLRASLTREEISRKEISEKTKVACLREEKLFAQLHESASRQKELCAQVAECGRREAEMLREAELAREKLAAETAARKRAEENSRASGEALKTAGERIAAYHAMSKDFFISTYRKMRRALGLWKY
jgi:hypothetical protein